MSFVFISMHIFPHRMLVLNIVLDVNAKSVIDKMFFNMVGQIGASGYVKPPDLFQGPTQNCAFLNGGCASPHGTGTTCAKICNFSFPKCFPYKMYILNFFSTVGGLLHTTPFLSFSSTTLQKFWFWYFFSKLWCMKTFEKLLLLERVLNNLHFVLVRLVSNKYV